MGSGRRPSPARLARKLRQIRLGLGLTQDEMFKSLGRTGTPLRVGHIGEFESGDRVPTLQVVLAYARAAEVSMEEIVDDKLRLPNHIPHVPDAKLVVKRRNHQ
jgi:transcriptional regulator with XRE-family HTH domain